MQRDFESKRRELWRWGKNSVEAQTLVPKVRTQRECLKCERDFESSGFDNRICYACKSAYSYRGAAVFLENSS